MNLPLPATAQVMYLIREEDDGPVKVGVSTKGGLARRLAQLQCGNPRELRLVGYMNADFGDEAVVHRCARMEGGHLRGEWFLASSVSLELKLAARCMEQDKKADRAAADEKAKALVTVLERNGTSVTHRQVRERDR